MKIIFTEATRKISIKNPVSIQVTEAPEMKPLNFILSISGIQAGGKIVIYLLQVVVFDTQPFTTHNHWHTTIIWEVIPILGVNVLLVTRPFLLVLKPMPSKSGTVILSQLKRSTVSSILDVASMKINENR